MRKLMASVLLVFLSSGWVSVAEGENSISIGGTKFDFDAPAPKLTAGQRDLVAQYKDAKRRGDEAALMSIQDESMKECATLYRDVILKDLKTPISDDARIVFFASSKDFAKDMGFGELAYLSARPTAILGIDMRRTTILRPVRQSGASWKLIPYCLTEKGKAMLEERRRSKQ
jgi:hypothetical protein